MWKRLHQALQQQLQDAGQIDWERASLDSASVPAPGGEATGKDPTNRGKLGTKRHLFIDRHGVPLAITVSGSNVHDSRMLEACVDAVPAVRQPHRQRGRPRQRPTKLHADKGYDYPRCRQALRRRGIIPPHRSSLVAASTRASGWDDFAGWSSGRSRGSIGFVA